VNGGNLLPGGSLSWDIGQCIGCRLWPHHRRGQIARPIKIASTPGNRQWRGIFRKPLFGCFDLLRMSIAHRNKWVRLIRTAARSYWRGIVAEMPRAALRGGKAGSKTWRGGRLGVSGSNRKTLDCAADMPRARLVSSVVAQDRHSHDHLRIGLHCLRRAGGPVILGSVVRRVLPCRVRKPIDPAAAGDFRHRGEQRVRARTPTDGSGAGAIFQ